MSKLAPGASADKRPIDAPAILREIDRLCRAALMARRLEAFDNVDIASLQAESEMSLARAIWIGRHLMRNSRSLGAYQEGQAILRLAGRLIDAPLNAKGESRAP